MVKMMGVSFTSNINTLTFLQQFVWPRLSHNATRLVSLLVQEEDRRRLASSVVLEHMTARACRASQVMR